MWQKPKPPRLSAEQRAILQTDYPRFSDAELQRRRDAIEALMDDADVSQLLICGQFFAGSAVPWLTGWLVTTEAVVVVRPGERNTMFVQYFNHLPLAQKVAVDADVRWGGALTIRSVAEELGRHGDKSQRVGVIGPLHFAARDVLSEVCGEVVDLNRGYVRLRLVKSQEELQWARIGAALSDLSIDALGEELRPGLNERDLSDIVEHAYVPWGGRTVIHFFGLTSMRDPDIHVPAQFPSTREIKAGDVMFTEISADYWGYGGQVLRTFTIDEDPSPLYRDLHNAADAAFESIFGVLRPGTRPEDIIEAATVIEDAGFTICDDLVHGYGGGYFPPVLGSKSRPNEPLPDMALEAGMMLVIQPNVITNDQRAGVQTGECVVITGDGAESLHDSPRGLRRVGRL